MRLTRHNRACASHAQLLAQGLGRLQGNWGRPETRPVSVNGTDDFPLELSGMSRFPGNKNDRNATVRSLKVSLRHSPSNHDDYMGSGAGETGVQTARTRWLLCAGNNDPQGGNYLVGNTRVCSTPHLLDSNRSNLENSTARGRRDSASTGKVERAGVENTKRT